MTAGRPVRLSPAVQDGQPSARDPFPVMSRAFLF